MDVDACDLCNEGESVSEGTLMKKMSSGGMVYLCQKCWNQVSRDRCGLCGSPDIAQEFELQNTVSENAKDGRTAPICTKCRNILGWNH